MAAERFCHRQIAMAQIQAEGLQIPGGAQMAMTTIVGRCSNECPLLEGDVCIEQLSFRKSIEANQLAIDTMGKKEDVNDG